MSMMYGAADQQPDWTEISQLKDRIKELIKREARLIEILKDVRNVLADYSGKGERSNEIYSKVQGILPIGHASRGFLRIEIVLKELGIEH